MRFATMSLAALVATIASITPAQAGWDNVFQPTLFGRNRQTTSNYAPCPPPCPAPCPAPCPPPCTTKYVQRSYYQPVTVMENRTVQEQVTTYRTSYYYEPVCGYRYSSYYDPCTCSTHQVATPTVSYQLREQKCPVQTWVSRCVQVPVQAYQKVDYWQPQTTCCSTTNGAPIFGSTAPPPQINVQPAPPQVNVNPAPPTVNVAPEMRPIDRAPEIKGSITPNSGKPESYERYYPPIGPSNGTSTPNTSWTPQLGNPIPIQPTAPTAPVKMDRIAVGPNSTVEGQVVRADNSPKPNAKVLFINASTGQKQTVTANSAGRFQTDLTTGSWHVYVHGANDLPVYQNRIDVNGSQFRQVSFKSE